MNKVCNRCGKEIDEVYKIYIYGEPDKYGGYTTEQAIRNMQSNIGCNSKKRYCLDCVKDIEAYIKSECCKNKD